MSKKAISDDIIKINLKNRVFEPVWDKIKESVEKNNMVPIRTKITTFYVKPEDNKKKDNGYHVSLVLEMMPRYRDLKLVHEPRDFLYIVSLRALVEEGSTATNLEENIAEFLVMDEEKPDKEWVKFIGPFVRVLDCSCLQTTFRSSFNSFFKKFKSNSLKFINADEYDRVTTVIQFPIKLEFLKIPDHEIYCHDGIEIDQKNLPPVPVEESTDENNKLGNVSFNLVSKKELPEELNINGILYKRVHDDDTVK